MALDLLLLHPGGREGIYQSLAGELAAIEPPLWCRLIAGYVRDRGFSVRILDSEALGLGPAAQAAHALETAPRLVVVVVTGHQPSASTQQMAPAGEACRHLKQIAPHLPVLMVGGHVSALPERTLDEEAVDYVCVGEGPVTVAALLEHLAGAGETLEQIPGLVWRRGETLVKNPPAPLFSDLDRDLHGQTWDLLPMARYRAHNWQCFDHPERRQPYAAIYTSLGCPYRCSFCCIHAPFGSNRYRMRSPAAVVAEILHLHDTHGVKTFKIVDEMFVLNERHVSAICDGLIDAGRDLNLWAYARVDTVKPGLLAKLKGAGITWLALGIESASESVRDGASKSFRNDDILGVVRRIQEAGIRVIGNFIFGLPDDDAASLEETFQLALTLNCEFVNFYSAMAYPGSPLYGEALASGWPLPDTWIGYSQHSYACTPLPTRHLTAREVLRFRDEAFHRYFAHPPYLAMIEEIFGPGTRRHLEEMARHRLQRKLLESA